MGFGVHVRRVQRTIFNRDGSVDCSFGATEYSLAPAETPFNTQLQAVHFHHQQRSLCDVASAPSLRVPVQSLPVHSLHLRVTHDRRRVHGRTER